MTASPRRVALVVGVACLTSAGTVSAAARTPAVPRIASAALTSSDLHGAAVTRQRYVAPGPAVTAYRREFGAIPYGSSRLFYALCDVSLAAYSDAGRLGIEAVETVPSKTFVAAQLASLPSLTSVSMVRRGRITIPGVLAYQIIVHNTSSAGRFDTAIVFIGSGRISGSFLLQSMVGSTIASADVARIGTAFAARISATSKRVSS